MVFEDLPADGVDFNVPLHTLRIAQFDLVNILAIFLFQLGVSDGGFRVLRQGDGIELFKGLNSTCIAQFQRLFWTLIPGLDLPGGEGECSGSDKSSQEFHGGSP